MEPFVVPQALKLFLICILTYAHAMLCCISYICRYIRNLFMGFTYQVLQYMHAYHVLVCIMEAQVLVNVIFFDRDSYQRENYFKLQCLFQLQGCLLIKKCHLYNHKKPAAVEHIEKAKTEKNSATDKGTFKIVELFQLMI